MLASRPETRPSEVSRRLVARGLHNLSIKLRPMIGRAVGDRPYDFIEAIVGHTAVAHFAGYRGLVLTIDEFEVEHRFANYWVRVRTTFLTSSRTTCAARSTNLTCPSRSISLP